MLILVVVVSRLNISNQEYSIPTAKWAASGENWNHLIGYQVVAKFAMRIAMMHKRGPCLKTYSRLGELRSIRGSGRAQFGEGGSKEGCGWNSKNTPPRNPRLATIETQRARLLWGLFRWPRVIHSLLLCSIMAIWQPWRCADPLFFLESQLGKKPKNTSGNIQIRV